MRKVLLLLIVLLGCSTPEEVALPTYDPIGAALAAAPAPAPSPPAPPVSTTTTVHYHAVAEAQETVTPTVQSPTPGSTYQRFERLADCESGERWYDEAGNVHFVPGSARWDLNTGNGYYGGLQFSAATWRQAGGTGLPHQHSKDTQISVAQGWLARTSWAQWPSCSRDLGFR